VQIRSSVRSKVANVGQLLRADQKNWLLESEDFSRVTVTGTLPIPLLLCPFSHLPKILSEFVLSFKSVQLMVTLKIS
jgi:hypothetical protein